MVRSDYLRLVNLMREKDLSVLIINRRGCSVNPIILLQLPKVRVVDLH